jgi:peptidase E
MTGSIDADDMPDNMRSWLQSYAEQIAFLPTSTSTTQKGVYINKGNKVVIK